MENLLNQVIETKNKAISRESFEMLDLPDVCFELKSLLTEFNRRILISKNYWCTAGEIEEQVEKISDYILNTL